MALPALCCQGAASGLSALLAYAAGSQKGAWYVDVADDATF